MRHDIHNGTLHLKFCNFIRNTALSKGGAVFTSGSHYGMINGCIFHNNHAQSGGALYSEDGSFTVHNCTFKQNMATISAGALCINATLLTISNSNLVGNMSPVGGTIYIFGHFATLHITNSKIWKNNYGKNEQGSGVAVCCFGAKHLLAHNVVFHDNNVGGISLVRTKGEIHNCSFLRNIGLAGAIYTQSSQIIVLTNTSFREYGAVALTLSENTVVQNCTFVAFIHSLAVQIDGTNGAEFRSHGNVFHVFHATSSVQDIAISLFSLGPTVHNSTLYFWDTWCQVDTNKPRVVDRDFMYNISTTIGKATDIPVNYTSAISPFASGKAKHVKLL